MALLFLDSCDLCATREQISRRWEPNGTSLSFLDVSATAGRWGGRAIQLATSDTGRIIRPIPPRQAVILAFAARFTRSASPVDQAFIPLFDGRRIPVGRMVVEHQCSRQAVPDDHEVQIVEILIVLYDQRASLPLDLESSVALVHAQGGCPLAGMNGI